MKLKKTKNFRFFEALKEGLKDIIAHRKGQLTLQAELVEINVLSKNKAKDPKEPMGKA